MSCPRCPRDSDPEIRTHYYLNYPQIKIRYWCGNRHHWVVYQPPIRDGPPLIKVFECLGWKRIMCMIRWYNPWDSALDHRCRVNKPLSLAKTVSSTPSPQSPAARDDLRL